MSNLAYKQSQSRRKAKRSSIRRALKLQSVTVITGHSSQRGTVLDLSENGMLIEVGKPINSLTDIKVDLPETRNVQATIVWTSGNYLGCQFAKPLARHVLSASLLRAEPRAISYSEIEEHIKASDSGLLELEVPSLSLQLRLIILCGASLILWGSIVLSLTILAF